mmetsp:Transcript_4873/g.12392  ORF Transcript_4873/g.12392 Transcript_4873/m.12392 type:complete len:385 (-) Transcript_4873:535-1689(-)
MTRQRRFAMLLPPPSSILVVCLYLSSQVVVVGGLLFFGTTSASIKTVLVDAFVVGKKNSNNAVTTITSLSPSLTRASRRQHASSLPFSTTSTSTSASTDDCDHHQDGRITVAMTREEGKNDKLRTKIENDHPDLFGKLNLVELPCIEHASGPDYDILADTLTTKQWDYIIVTSPEAAKVLASAWSFNNNDDDDANVKPMVAAVGKATEKSLKDAGIDVSFCPSKATAATLAVELEPRDNDTKMTTVLYPASARAQNTLEDGLTNRGCFAVTRLNTYDTVTATWDDDQQNMMIGSSPDHTQIACFASPSSIKGWLLNTNNNNGVYAACIGETSAKACRELGWDEERIFSPDKPGLDGWISAIEEATEKIVSTTSAADSHTVGSSS